MRGVVAGGPRSRRAAHTAAALHSRSIELRDRPGRRHPKHNVERNRDRCRDQCQTNRRERIRLTDRCPVRAEAGIQCLTRDRDEGQQQEKRDEAECNANKRAAPTRAPSLRAERPYRCRCSESLPVHAWNQAVR